MTMMMLRNSERQTFKKCRHRWAWTYRDGRQATEAAHALRFGDLIHRALAEYYIPGVERGTWPARAFERIYKEDAQKRYDEGFDIWSDDKWVEALPLGVAMLEGYVERFAAEEQEWEVISSEQTFQLRLRTDPVRLLDHLLPAPLKFKMVGTFDGVWRHRRLGYLIFKEFKTAASIQTDALAMDEQASTYWTYGPRFLRQRGLLGPDEMPREILYTFLRKAAPPDGPTNELGQYLNKDGSVSKRQPAPFFHREPIRRDLATRTLQHERVVQEAIDIARARAGSPDVPLYKNPGPIHMPNCRGCPVRDACEVHEAGGDWQSVLAATTTKWDPYAAHELPERH